LLTRGWLAKARASVVRDLLIDISYRLTFAMELADGALMLLSYVFLARVFGALRPDGYDPLAFLLLGIVVSSALSTVTTCFALGLRGAEVTGTIKAVMATPTSPVTYLLLSALYPLGRAVGDVLIMLAFGSLLGLRLARDGLAGASLVLALGLVAMAVLGVLAAAFTVVFKRGNPAAWAIASVTWLLSGVLYPVSVLPAGLARLAWWLPTTHTLSAMRALLIDGARLGSVASHVWYLAGFAMMGLPLSLWVFARAIDYAKRQGTLGHA
jgi:ABC-2 type transport system permease protein